MSSKNRKPASSPHKRNLKQGNLFSFFTTKPSPKKASSSTSTASVKEPKVKSSSNQTPVDELGIPVGTRLSVFWPDDKEYYNCKVDGKRGNMYTLLYDDGDVETVELRNEKYKILTSTTTKVSKTEKSNENSGKRTSNPNSASNETEKYQTSPKKRRVLQDYSDDDDYVHSDDNGDGDESEYEAPANDEEDEDDDISMMVTDDENENDAIKSRKNKQLQKATIKNHHRKANASNSGNIYNKSNITLKSSSVLQSDSPNSSEAPNNLFSKYKITPIISPPPQVVAATSGSDDSNQGPSATMITSKKQKMTPQLSSSPSKNSSISNNYEMKKKLLQNLDPKAVNPAGSHYHNHYKFMYPEFIRDFQGRSRSDPGYNPRTLRVDYNEIERVTKSKISPAQKQWWEIKSQYFDTVLLFKTGKFYEMFHMDADIGVKYLKHVYMKGSTAHSGFPEVGYASFSAKLVQAGFKVARVEQTETPAALKERRKKTKGIPNVVAREVCSIVSAGTRTFCFMDDRRLLENGNSRSNDNLGPLLAIQEIKVPPTQENMEAVWEYGITVVNAITGTVTLGQFADDILKSRMKTLLTHFAPSEVLVHEHNVSPELISLLQQQQPACRIEKILTNETFPKSTAVDLRIRKRMERQQAGQQIHPWDVEETIRELHRQSYYPRASRRSNDIQNTTRWPAVLQACMKGEANLCVGSFGAALFYLQRSLIDYEILSMGIVQAYCPPNTTSPNEERKYDDTTTLEYVARESVRKQDSLLLDNMKIEENVEESEQNIDHMALDGTTLANLEILTNLQSHTSAGSLWSKLNHTRTPHGSRLLRAWLLRPLFRVTDVKRRADAVSELTFGSGAAALSEARSSILNKCGDMERLLSRVHSMSGSNASSNDDQDDQNHHPQQRAVLYETPIYTKRQVGDFSKLLNGLHAACQIPELFQTLPLKKDGLLHKIVNLPENGGCFPDMREHLQWFFDNFDCDLAAKGLFEPARGMDERYDAACDEIERIESQLEEYREEMCNHELRPSSLAQKSWKYANTKVDSKDKYLIELPVGVQVPSDFYIKGKRGSGAKQINKYRTPIVEKLVQDLELALDIAKECKSLGIQLVFAKFDSMRALWTAAAQTTAMLDALGSLAEVSSQAGYTRPTIVECPSNACPYIEIVQGKHPCVNVTHNGGDFIPNDLTLGGKDNSTGGHHARTLLLSGPNMGGKSTLLRQTCLISILAQIGCFVPAEKCTLTPIDRIYTRLGASDRILLGQSTFFVELAETAAALRGASRRSLVIMDELGRGTSTFDGTAIASATVNHLVEKNKCLTLFATHYHSLLEDWKNVSSVRFGHMECFVDDVEDDDDFLMQEKVEKSSEKDDVKNITFLYTLGEGTCPKSFGINVARLAALPPEVLSKAKQVSTSFEAEMNGHSQKFKITPENAVFLKKKIELAVSEEKWDELEQIWEGFQE